jgi:hypothetical protein
MVGRKVIRDRKVDKGERGREERREGKKNERRGGERRRRGEK